MLYNKDLNVFREGGSHKINPIGGIPQGVGINGRLNLVEEGETAFDLKNGRYIFSDRLSLRNQMENSLITEFNLPSYIKGKTFAEASKLIDKKFKDRNDNASLKTKETLMERLQEAQEYVKMQNAMKVNSQEVPAISTDTPPGMNVFGYGGTNKYAEGGFSEFMENNGTNIFNGLNVASNLFSMAKGNTGNENTLSSGLTGVMKGAQVGTAIAPGAGTLIGGGIGAITGLIGAGNAKKKRLEQDMKDTHSFYNKSYNTFDLGGFANKALRFTPVLGNALQLSKLEKPVRESREQIDTRYKTYDVDEMQFQNIAANEFNNTNEAIANASGGNKSAIRAGVLASGLNRNKALSNAYLRANEINRRENDMAQQFNFGVDRVNLYQDNLEKEVNARNEGAYQTEKSKLQASLFNDLGNIGKERSQMKSIEKMYGYTWDGEYLRDKEGKIVTDKEIIDKNLKKFNRKNKKKLKKDIKKNNVNANQPLDFSIYLGEELYNA